MSPVTSWLSAFVYLALWQMRLELFCVSVSPATTRPSQLDLWPASSNVTSQTKDCRRHLNCFTSSVAASHAQAHVSMDLSVLDFSRDSPWKRISLALSSGDFQTPRRRGLTQWLSTLLLLLGFKKFLSNQNQKVPFLHVISGFQGTRVGPRSPLMLETLQWCMYMGDIQ